MCAAANSGLYLHCLTCQLLSHYLMKELLMHFTQKYTEWLRFKGVTVDHPVPSLCSTRVTKSTHVCMQCLQRRRPHSLPAQPLPVFVTLTVKKLFSHLCGTSYAPACTRCPLSYHWMALKRAGSILLTLSLYIFININNNVLLKKQAFLALKNATMFYHQQLYLQIHAFVTNSQHVSESPLEIIHKE